GTPPEGPGRRPRGGAAGARGRGRAPPPPEAVAAPHAYLGKGQQGCGPRTPAREGRPRWEARAPMPRQPRLRQVEDYEPFVGAETVDRIRRKAEPLRGFHVAHVNSTYYGGGVAELLSSLTLLMSSVGLRTGWRAIHGSPDFFSITKKMHNALQGGDINMTELKKEIYEDVLYENAVRNDLDHDFVVIHDP